LVDEELQPGEDPGDDLGRDLSAVYWQHTLQYQQAAAIGFVAYCRR